MRNRMWNVTNPCQGPEKKILCVCSAGLLRSPTAAHLLALRGHNTRAAGLEADFALIPVDNVLIAWADLILCMDHNQKEKISLFNFAEGKEVVSLNIPDNFNRMDAALVKLLNKQFDEMGL